MKYVLLLFTVMISSHLVAQVGINNQNPNATLDVNGEIKVGNTNVACGAINAGAMRYNAATSQIEYCDGTAWVSLKINNSSSVYATMNNPASIQNIGTVYTNIILPNTQITGTAITYDNTTGIFTLQPNRTYVLTASVNHTNDFYTIMRWFDLTTPQQLGTRSQMSPQNATMPDDAVGAGFVHFIFRPVVQTQVAFQVKRAGNNGTTNIGFNNGEGLRAPFASIHTID